MASAELARLSFFKTKNSVDVAKSRNRCFDSQPLFDVVATLHRNSFKALVLVWEKMQKNFG